MRTIKFRGRLIHNGEWAYGNLVEIDRPFNLDAETVYFIMPKYVLPSQPEVKAEHEVVDAATIGQFTGLYDKKGTEIYEGDILVLPANTKVAAYEAGEAVPDKFLRRFAVVWSKQNQGFGLCTPFEAKSVDSPDVGGMAAVDRMFIVGTIYDEDTNDDAIPI